MKTKRRTVTSDEYTDMVLFVKQNRESLLKDAPKTSDFVEVMEKKLGITTCTKTAIKIFKREGIPYHMENRNNVSDDLRGLDLMIINLEARVLKLEESNKRNQLL